MLLREFTEQELINLYPAFLAKLKDGLEYLSDGGTSYRIETAQISLNVAIQAGTILPFILKEDAKSTVLNYFPNLDYERIGDVSKFLTTIANHFKIETFLTEDAKKYFEQRKLNRLQNPVKLVRVKE